MPGYRRFAARDEPRSKTMDFAPAELSAPDPRQVLTKRKTMDLAPAELSAPVPGQVLRKRLSEEMDALRCILRKAELVVRKNVDKGRAAPRRGKDGRFSAAEARSEADRTPCAKRRNAMPPVEIIEPLPRISKADRIPCAKKRRTTTPVEIIEPRISKDEIFSLVSLLSSLSSNMPARILEFLNKECTVHADQNAGEIEIDLGSMRRPAMFQLQKLLDEFAEEKCWQQKEDSVNVCRSIARSSPRELEESEFIEEVDCASTPTADTCDDDASHVATATALCSPTRILEDEEEEIDICGDASTIAIEKVAETKKSPSNSSSSSSSGSSSSGGGTAGSSCSDSSDTESSDSGSDDKCVTSNVAPAFLPKTDASPIAMSAKGLCSPPRILQAGEMTEEEGVICSNTGPIPTRKFAESAESPNNSSCSSSSGSSSSSDSSSGSSCSDSSTSDSSSDSDRDNECVTSNPAPAVVPKTDACPVAMPAKVLCSIATKEFAETGKSQRSSSSSLLEDGEIEEKHEFNGASPVAAEKFAETVNGTASANDKCIRSNPAPAVSPEPLKLQSAAQGSVRHLYASGFEKKRERAVAAHGTVRHFYAKDFEKRERAVAAKGTVRHFYAKDFEKKRERRRFYAKLEEMERNAKAKPIFDWIHPRHLRQLGITTPVEYAITSERRLPARLGCPVQSLLGFFLKAE